MLKKKKKINLCDYGPKSCNTFPGHTWTRWNANPPVLSTVPWHQEKEGLRQPSLNPTSVFYLADSSLLSAIPLQGNSVQFYLISCAVEAVCGQILFSKESNAHMLTYTGEHGEQEFLHISN